MFAIILLLLSSFLIWKSGLGEKLFTIIALQFQNIIPNLYLYVKLFFYDHNLIQISQRLLIAIPFIYYKYHYTDILFTFMYPDWVLVSNILLSIVNLYFGMKLLNKKTSIKRSYLTMLILITVGGLINNLSVV